MRDWWNRTMKSSCFWYLNLRIGSYLVQITNKTTGVYVNHFGSGVKLYYFMNWKFK